MHFGEYLVQKKVLSAHQILKALAEQRRQRQFLPLLLVEQGALPDHRALRYCTQAEQNNEEFLDVLHQEGLISKEQLDSLHHTWRHSGPPLGRLLVEMKYIDMGTISELLKKFEAERALEENLAQIS